ncbi:hydrogen peroxide-inducible genes activator [Alteriqipengyuania lutimaris]|uniref:Hydrogen peroxide-inducible genes activator n=1 Tax=Alteriqipengyuania lutimaris TaxID=1538146 RepID=A0A395LLM0_9SPHN|nr:hydrogen peroxide-inducible genes activator [Alteriqipengyuania lutimaris]MBB3033297.1 LysR family hydrogen peroxide-inducible transcriptional activator [Alteriqipengyuania lutimaris]RDS77665.1 hydrogen peroxide-inducible genes activator [Alteriqipengyuania lutimaris]
MAITLKQLRYLTTLQEERHFGRAASRLNVTQPTLSQQVRQLEAMLGATLVERGQPASLTPIGRDIARRAREILSEVAEIQHLADRAQGMLSGTVRFGVTPTLGPYLMPKVVTRLHAAHPELRLHIREGIPDEQARALANAELDMLLAPLPIDHPRLHVEPLFREPLALVGPPDHPLHRKGQATARDFEGEAILSLDPRHHYSRQVADICDDLHATLLRDYEGTSLDGLQQMSGSGLGLAILPETYLRSESGGEHIVRRFAIADWEAYRSIAGVWRKGSVLADAFAQIAAVITEEANRTLA